MWPPLYYKPYLLCKDLFFKLLTMLLNVFSFPLSLPCIPVCFPFLSVCFVGWLFVCVTQEYDEGS